MGEHHMMTLLKTAALPAALVLGLAAGTAMAQDAPAPAPAPAPTEQAAPSGENWNPFSSSTVKIYMADVNGIVTTGDVVSARVAKVPLQGAAGDYSYAVDQIEMRCGAKQSRLVASTEYGPDGAQTDHFDDAEDWGPYAPDTRDGYLAQLICDGDRGATTWPSIKAFINAGRK
jgi:hypothetical protein